MRYIECPKVYDGGNGTLNSLFLAGGITGCRDWQAELVEMLKDEKHLVILNPRRKNFPIDDTNSSRAQIEWEYKHLGMASAVSFWFPKETLCPITLYELGKQSAHYFKPIMVGVHPKYKRREDVEIQTKLIRPEVRIAKSLEGLAQEIRIWLRE